MTLDPLTLVLSAPLIIPIGLGIAAWAYPWRSPTVRPYLWFALALISPLALMIALQARFGLPAGSCVQRPLNYVPLVLAGLSLVLGIGLSYQAKRTRRFVIGIALAICPVTLFWSAIAVMSLAGCWI